MGLRRKFCAKGHFLLEVLIRISLGVLFFHLEKATPFKRVLHQEDILLHHNNPITADYVPVRYLWIAVILMPILIFAVTACATRNKKGFLDAFLGFSLALPLNGVITDIVKLIVGRPRPDFFWRCFPNGEMNSEMECTGDPRLVMEGRKSFPSGHSSFSFVGMGYLSLFLADRLHLYTEKGRGQSWRLLLCLAPLLGALVVALSRTCDYHHHWQDVLVGSILGYSIAFFCYRQYFPKKPIRTPTRTIRESELLQILELASESLRNSQANNEEGTGEEAKLMALSNTKWI